MICYGNNVINEIYLGELKITEYIQDNKDYLPYLFLSSLEFIIDWQGNPIKDTIKVYTNQNLIFTF